MTSLPPTRPTVFSFTTDIHGKLWHVNERRPTAHGFPVELGWPADYGGPGAARAILTPALADYLRRVPRSVDLDVPLTSHALSRFRMLLGMDYRTQRERWWQARLDDLKALSHREFARRHGVAEITVNGQFVRRFGARRRPAGWYREPRIAEVLLAFPTREAAAQLGISHEAAMTFRKVLRRAS